MTILHFFAQLLLSSYLHVLLISICLINIWRYIYPQTVFFSSGSAENYVSSNFIQKIEISEGNFTFLHGKQRQHPFSFFSNNNGPGVHVFYSNNPCRCAYDPKTFYPLDSLFFLKFPLISVYFLAPWRIFNNWSVFQ